MENSSLTKIIFSIHLSNHPTGLLPDLLTCVQKSFKPIKPTSKTSWTPAIHHRLVALKQKHLLQASATIDPTLQLYKKHSNAKNLEFLSHTRPAVFLSLLIYLILCETQGHGQLSTPTFRCVSIMALS